MYRFGEWLRRERLEHGWSQVELAEKTYGEISQAPMSGIVHFLLSWMSKSLRQPVNRRLDPSLGMSST